MGAFSPEAFQIQPAESPTLTSVPMTGDWVTMALFDSMAIVVNISAQAGTDITFTVEQATNNSGSGAKALAIRSVWRKRAADIKTVGVFTRVDPTTSNTYLTDGDFDECFVLDIESAELDRANGFNWIHVNHDSAAGPRVASVLYILSDQRYGQAVQSSVI